VNDAAILDEAVLAELSESVGGDTEFVADLIRTYVAEGSTYLEQMSAAVASTDIAAIVRPAHSLKSSSASLGAARLAQVSRDLEAAAREGRADEAATLVEAARTAWDDTVAELEARGLSA
jgi:two-component system sensor histidine kinase BarA